MNRAATYKRRKIMTINRYKELSPKKNYRIFVSKMPLCGYKQMYRIGLFEEFSCAECFDLNLALQSERRILEEYVNNKRMNVKVDKVLFGHECGNHYELNVFLKKSPFNDYLKDIKI